jgi:EamA domain-containing membrane protein RarD
MNTLLSFTIEVAFTLIVCLLLVRYLQPHLQHVLIDLCRTEERAQFWTVFSNILLVGLPTIKSLGFHSATNNTLETGIFEIAKYLSGNMIYFILALVAAGLVVGFFALVAPRPSKAETK